MSEGTIRQFVDFTDANDDNQDNADSIQPIANGENVYAGVGGVANRPAENLRLRSEVIRGVLADLQYLASADRHLYVAGPGLVTWPGVFPGDTGIVALSDSLYLVPALTPGLDANLPPVASAFGTLQLVNAAATGGILCTSMRRSYSGGDQINIEVVPGAALSVVQDADTRTILVTAINGVTVLSEVVALLNALIDGETTQYVNATYYGAGLAGDLFLSTQARQFIAGNYDGEAHLITAANLATFFAADAGANVLREGDTLCIWYEYLVDPGTPATLGGRRQSIPENTNTTIVAGAFFNSRVHPERLVNALPVAKVLNGNLILINGIAVPTGAVDYSPVVETAWGPGATWFDSTANPATTLAAQISKILVDLGAAAGTGAAKIGAPIVAGAPHDWPAAVGVDTALADLLGWINAHFVGSTDQHDADKIVAPTAAGTPHAWGAPGEVATRLADLLGWLNAHFTGADAHPAADVDYAGGPAWADAVTNPAATVEAQLDKIITDLSTGDGANKLISGTVSTAGFTGSTGVGDLLLSAMQGELAPFPRVYGPSIFQPDQNLTDTWDYTGGGWSIAVARVGDYLTGYPTIEIGGNPSYKVTAVSVYLKDVNDVQGKLSCTAFKRDMTTGAALAMGSPVSSAGDGTWQTLALTLTTNQVIGANEMLLIEVSKVGTNAGVRAVYGAVVTAEHSNWT